MHQMVARNVLAHVLPLQAPCAVKHLTNAEDKDTLPMKNLVSAVILTFAATSFAAIHTETIPYKEGETELTGFLAYDNSTDAKRPGILIVHEWWGLDEYPKKRARQLAEMGYVAFAADIYGKGKVTKDRKQAAEWAGAMKSDRQLLRKRANAGLEVLKGQDQVDPGKLAAIGYCFGGTAVLELARSGADVRGVVSFHGALDTPSTATQDAKNIKGSILVLTGGEDRAVPDSQISAFMDEMRAADVDWQVNIYGGAVHTFTNPAAGSDKSTNSAYNEEADRRSWEAMKDFFDEVLK